MFQPIPMIPFPTQLLTSTSNTCRNVCRDISPRNFYPKARLHREKPMLHDKMMRRIIAKMSVGS